jgi:uncharacterized membrane protein
MRLSDRAYNRFAGQKVARIEAISDGVFAVALTLLVLDIKEPVQSVIHTEGDLMRVFCSLTPKFLSYFLSFMTLGIFWTGQSLQYTYIERSDRHLNWLALFFLLFVSVLPFTTAFLSAHIQFKFAIGVYWFNIFMLGMLLLVHWDYAVRNKFINVSPDTLAAISSAVRNRIIIALILYGTAALLCFLNTILSISIIIGIQLHYALGLFYRKKSLQAGKNR